MRKENIFPNQRVLYKSRMMNLMKTKLAHIPQENKREKSLNQYNTLRYALEENIPISAIITHNQCKQSLSSCESFHSLSPTNRLNK